MTRDELIEAMALAMVDVVDPWADSTWAGFGDYLGLAGEILSSFEIAGLTVVPSPAMIAAAQEELK